MAPIAMCANAYGAGSAEFAGFELRRPQTGNPRKAAEFLRIEILRYLASENQAIDVVFVVLRNAKAVRGACTCNKVDLYCATLGANDQRLTWIAP